MGQSVEKTANARVIDMHDLAYIAMVLGFFWIGLLYVRVADKL